MDDTLSPEELERYDRQLMIPELGPAGQLKLRSAKVAIVGAGGLGSSVAYYLAAAGVGDITLIDFDEVELSNLNRQILHSAEDIGAPKVESAVGKLAALNPDIGISGVRAKLTPQNADELLGDADVLVDALDNFPARFVLNEAAVRLKKPYFHGACWGLEGRAATIIPGETPCLRCIFPVDPPDETAPILGTTPGIIGAMEALEVVKHVAGIPGLLTGKLMIFDGKSWEFKLIKVNRDPACPVCGSGK